MAYLVLPQTQGARVLYLQYVEPCLEHHEREIEELIGRTHERAKDLGLQYFYKAIDLIREKILGLPPQRAAAPPPQPTGPAAYAQSLLSRFNLPITATGATNVAAPASDWLSAIGSALATMTSTAGQSREAHVEQLSASGGLMPREMETMSRTEKVKFLSSQRELLDALRSALAKEELNLRDDDTASDKSADGVPLKKNRSDNSFLHIGPEDIPGSSSAGQRDRSPAGGARIPPATGGWTSGWFGHGEEAGSSGVHLAAADQNARPRT